jgi:hypothetical protein
MHDELWPNAWAWRQAYLRRPARAVAALLDVIEERQERERHTLIA